MRQAAAPHPNPLPVKNGERGRAKRSVKIEQAGTACPFAPPAGRRCRQADEGRILAIISMT
ncbi:hypothetical protein ELI49_16860 [Rhizobium ruizarguesonis]|nr:hypothetical protein [Rhizobium leguminosarum bv. viciae]NKQ75498.1 hypothetical protein [Rhizobium ruizarguesonis]NKQ77182.1 hypothetical protein [Rhizobium ruizarguesonis]TAU11297.1 hypothetical protein ELI49_16860 [Rhizobium ruizarguesonis]TAW78922.1 hypothetical protein ELI10_17815 [Rhizobium ruizarguesonis]